MTTNVKPGDRAVVVRATHPRNLGKVVHVIEQVQPVNVIGTMVYNVAGQMVIARPDDGVVWVVESLGSPFVGVRKNGEEVAVMIAPCSDKCLRPLRDTDGTDEALLIARSRGDSLVTYRQEAGTIEAFDSTH